MAVQTFEYKCTGPVNDAELVVKTPHGCQHNNNKPTVSQLKNTCAQVRINKNKISNKIFDYIIFSRRLLLTVQAPSCSRCRPSLSVCRLLRPQCSRVNKAVSSI